MSVLDADTNQLGEDMFEFSEFCCPFRAEVAAAIPVPLAMLIHGIGILAVLFFEP